jgi:hypothetical protein
MVNAAGRRLSPIDGSFQGGDLRIIVKGAFLILAHLDADQLALDIVALCQSV